MRGASVIGTHLRCSLRTAFGACAPFVFSPSVRPEKPRGFHEGPWVVDHVQEPLREFDGGKRLYKNFRGPQIPP
jgi:hypothetical protein